MPTPRRSAGLSDPVWSACLAVAARRRHGSRPVAAGPGRPDRSGSLAGLPGADDAPLLGLYRPLLELYRPILDVPPGGRLVVGHLGQSIDGRIATRSGDSNFVTGPANLDHLHRMRALCDAVLVGANTIELDDPQLTTRRVPGEHPTRVVIDPAARLPVDRRVFADDGVATLLACASQVAAQAAKRFGAARVLAVQARDGRLPGAALLDALAARGLRVVFVEGGGVTVSRLLEQTCLDRLQITVAPVIVGDGRNGLQLPGAASMHACARPPCRVYPMGEDVLWDFDLRAASA